MMNAEQMDAARARIDAKLTVCVAEKLGTTAVLLRYDRNPKTFADTPVFGVPASHLERARALGLIVEASDAA